MVRCHCEEASTMGLTWQSHGAKRLELSHPAELASRIGRFALAITLQSSYFEPRTDAHSPNRPVVRYFFLWSIITLLLLLCLTPAQAEESWPEGLKEAASKRLSVLQVREFEIRDSTLLDPQGVIPANIFDRTSHKCHEGSGQQYRRFGEPVYLGLGDEGIHLVQTAIQVFYRQGVDLKGLYDQPWKQGTDMAFQISFDQSDGKWNAVLERELIQMDEIPSGMPGGIKEGGHPGQ